MSRPKSRRHRETAGALGAPSAEEEEEDTSPLSQQREVGGDSGGGRPQNGGVSWEQSCGKLRPRRHEHRMYLTSIITSTFLCIKNLFLLIVSPTNFNHCRLFSRDGT